MSLLDIVILLANDVTTQEELERFADKVRALLLDVVSTDIYDGVTYQDTLEVVWPAYKYVWQVLKANSLFAAADELFQSWWQCLSERQLRDGSTYFRRGVPAYLLTEVHLAAGNFGH